MAGVAIKGVKKRFGKRDILHGIDVAVQDGQFLVVVGPSGCGKSTLLRLIAGLETVDAGTIAIGGEVVNDVEPMHRNVAMVFQNYALYPHMNVFQNMAYGLKVRHTPRPEIRRRVTAAAEMLGLEDYLERKPRQLSGGQRQRVAMGRAMVRDPSVFLLDEPLSNLDAKLRNQMRIELKRLHRRLGNTFIFVTHDQVEAMTLGDRILVMNEGRVEQIGTPLDIYHRPRTVFTAEFMGSPTMNLLRGHLVAEGRRLLLDGGLQVPLARPQRPCERELIVGIRPEDLAVVPERGGRNNCFAAEVDIVESLGGDTVVHCRMEGAADPLVVRLHPETPFGMDHRIHMRMNPEKLHLFDAQTGLRLETDPDAGLRTDESRPNGGKRS